MAVLRNRFGCQASPIVPREPNRNRSRRSGGGDERGRPRRLRFARHLRGDIWEVRIDAERKAFRVLFSSEGRSQQVLLALEAFTKKTQKTPARAIQLAERRLADWRRRGRGAQH